MASDKFLQDELAEESALATHSPDTKGTPNTKATATSTGAKPTPTTAFNSLLERATTSKRLSVMYFGAPPVPKSTSTTTTPATTATSSTDTGTKPTTTTPAMTATPNNGSKDDQLKGIIGEIALAQHHLGINMAKKIAKSKERAKIVKELKHLNNEIIKAQNHILNLEKQKNNLLN